MIAVQTLLEKISYGRFNTNCLRKRNEQQQQHNIFHLQQSQSQNQQQMTPDMIKKLQHREELNQLRKEIELAKFRVQLLTYEKSRKEKELKHLDNIRNSIIEKNHQKGWSLI